MTDSEKARLYDKLVSIASKINDWGSLFHYQITIPAINNQTFEEALIAIKTSQPEET
jgi:hypothetical protein